ncbi:MAG TPA: class II aldolase/adducin family protein [Kiritimatiellia bacterium]|nr:class II aldolase/adducin family protein [Kiritimatiellia bacterium]HPR69041.1 class II aldolase/adducin family protein [Kiritimatiellia bacterium]HRX06327.1 class II aldolase/adducin family protein [Kiritimatiellia bacterium]
MRTDEGYIKFSCAHEAAPPPRHPWLHDLCRIRDDLHDWRLIGVLPDGIGYGNLSARLEDTLRFVVTASGTGFEYPIAERHFCEVQAFDIAQNTVTCRGPLPASSESMSHGAVYAARPDTRAVIHIHDRLLFRMLLAEDAPRTPPDAAFGTPEIARAIGQLAPALPPVAILVMAGHEDGLLAFAPDPRAARDALWTAYSRSRRQ